MRNIFWQTLKKNGLLLVILIAAIIASIAVGVTPPLILQYIVDSLVSGSFSAYPLLTAGILYFALNAGSGLVDALKETLITVFGQKITHGLRSAMCQRLDELPAAYFVSHEAGAVTSLFVNDVDTLENLFDSGVVSMIADAFTILSILVVVFHLSLGLGILLCICLPLLFILTRYFQKRMLQAQLNSRICERISAPNAASRVVGTHSQPIKNTNASFQNRFVPRVIQRPKVAKRDAAVA